MSKMIEVLLDNGSKIYFETFDTNDDSDELLDSVSGNRLVRKTKDFLTSTFTQLKMFSNGLAESIKNIDFQPDEFEIEYSVKFTADAGIIISSVASEASITVKMKWDKSKGE